MLACVKTLNISINCTKFLPANHVVHAHSLFSPENRDVTYKLLRYSFYMVTMPVAAFYLSKNTLFQGKRDGALACNLSSFACLIGCDSCVPIAFVCSTGSENALMYRCVRSCRF